MGRLRHPLEQEGHEPVDALAGRGRDAHLGSRRVDQRGPVGRGHQVDLGHEHDLGTVGQPAAVQGELAVDRVAPPDDVARVRVRFDQVDQQARSLEVGEELVAEADGLAGALEQAGDVGDGQLAAVGGLDGAERRLEP